MPDISNRPGSGGNSGSGGGICNTANASMATLCSTLVGLNTVGDYGRAGVSPSFIGIPGGLGIGLDVRGEFHSEGHNLISTVLPYDGSGFTNGVNGDSVGLGYTLEPKLGALQNNGGATFTVALLSDSPAVDTGDDALLAAPFNLERDQRGVARKSGSQVDIGGFEHAAAPVWLPTTALTANWSALACSADGRRLVAAVDGGGIYISSDAGATWTLTSAPNTNWSAVASSANGSHLVGAVAVFNAGHVFEQGGPIYVSADAGVTRAATTAPITNWSSVSCSADGSKMVAVAGGYISYIRSAPSGPIYRSIDFGTTWIPTSVGDANCTSLTSSANGSRLVAATYLGRFRYSRDSGANWNDVGTTFAYLVSVASSADGERLVAGTFDPFHPVASGGHFDVVFSTNSGGTWNYVAAGGIGRGLVAASADGTAVIAAGAANGFGVGGQIFVSTNSGSDWATNESPTGTWSAVAASADGGRFIAAMTGGGIWTLRLPAPPRLSLSAAGGNVVVSWIVPSIDVILEQSPDLAATNWSSSLAPFSLDAPNLREQAILAAPQGRQFFRLRR